MLIFYVTKRCCNCLAKSSELKGLIRVGNGRLIVE
jgi:hypothetical protein